MELKQLPLLQHRPITVALLMLTAANLEVEEVAANRGVCELALQLLIPEILPANSLKEALELEKIRVQIPEFENRKLLLFVPNDPYQGVNLGEIFFVAYHANRVVLNVLMDDDFPQFFKDENELPKNLFWISIILDLCEAPPSNKRVVRIEKTNTFCL